VLAVVADDDLQKLSKLGFAQADARMPADEVEGLIEQRKAAKTARDFARADAIRKQLTDSGIILEDSKDGSVRWKYK
jgi:cysteinyl-tRNA synthetase